MSSFLSHGTVLACLIQNIWLHSGCTTIPLGDSGTTCEWTQLFITVGLLVRVTIVRLLNLISSKANRVVKDVSLLLSPELLIDELNESLPSHRQATLVFTGYITLWMIREKFAFRNKSVRVSGITVELIG